MDIPSDYVTKFISAKIQEILQMYQSGYAIVQGNKMHKIMVAYSAMLGRWREGVGGYRRGSLMGYVD